MESQTGEGIIRQVSMCLREMLFGIETWLIWGLCSSGTLRRVDWWLLQTFQASYLSHFQGSCSVRRISDRLLKTAPTACPEKSVNKYQRCLTSSRPKVSIWNLALTELDKKRPNGEIWPIAYIWLSEFVLQHVWFVSNFRKLRFVNKVLQTVEQNIGLIYFVCRYTTKMLKSFITIITPAASRLLLFLYHYDIL
jgi:hypothetical protein